MVWQLVSLGCHASDLGFESISWQTVLRICADLTRTVERDIKL